MNDEDYMRLAIEEAAKAAKEEEIPVGAIAVLNGKVIAAEHNRMEQLKDATAHAEILLLRKAGTILNDWRMSEVTVYVTKEPCVMCGGAMVNAHLKKVVYGLPDPRSGADTFNLLRNPDLLYHVESIGGILADECRKQFQSFFIRRRNEQKSAKKKNDDFMNKKSNLPL